MAPGFERLHPEGMAETSRFRPSLRDLSCTAPTPGAETPGGFRLSLRDTVTVAPVGKLPRWSWARVTAPRPGALGLVLALLLLCAGLSGCGLIGPLISAAAPYAGLKLMFACIPEHTLVDTPAGPRPIEKLEPGDSVIGYAGKPVRILQKHSYLENPETAFFHVTIDGGAAVDLCGMHRLAGIRARDIPIGGTIAGRKVTGVETRRGVLHSYDLLTEDAGYRIQGLPVNSMIEEMNLAAISKRPRPIAPPKGKASP
jgi:hypothetical protein